MLENKMSRKRGAWEGNTVHFLVFLCVEGVYWQGEEKEKG